MKRTRNIKYYYLILMLLALLQIFIHEILVFSDLADVNKNI